MESIEKRVAKGAAWLDEHEPGWERKIDLASLNLASSCKCVLGQLWGDYNLWRGYIVPKDWAVDSVSWPLAHGFTNLRSWWDTPTEKFQFLDEAWITLIKERFNSGLLSDGHA